MTLPGTLAVAQAYGLPVFDLIEPAAVGDTLHGIELPGSRGLPGQDPGRGATHSAGGLVPQA